MQQWLLSLGYGNIIPRTQLGRGFTIISCLLGIPITMMLFKTTGEILATCITYLVIKTETVMLKRAEPKHVKTKSFLSACALVVFQLIIASASTIYLEDWNFFGGSVFVVYNLHNDWFWRLCAYGFTAEGNRSWGDPAYSLLRLFCTCVSALHSWFEPDVVHLELSRRFCGWNTKCPGTDFELLSKFTFTCAKGVLTQNRWLSCQWLITRNMLKTG